MTALAGRHPVQAPGRARKDKRRREEIVMAGRTRGVPQPTERESQVERDWTVPDVSAEVAELRDGAMALRAGDAAGTALAGVDMELALADLLTYAAERLERHPDAVGGMTQHSLTVARAVLTVNRQP